jgi:hypothetical protein
LVAALAVALTIALSGVAHAAAGDDAHAVTTKLSQIPDGSQAPSNVACPAGEHAIGGGERPFSTDGTGYFLTESGPLIDGVDIPRAGDAPTQWFARTTNISGKSKDFVIYAVCSASTDAVVRFVDFTTPDQGAASEASTVVPCLPNERAIGGGLLGKTVPPLSLEASMPLTSTQGTIDSLNDNDVAHAWYLDARTNGSTQLRAYAVCSPTSQATIQVETTFFPNSGYTLNMYVPCPSGERALAGGVGTMQPNLTPGIEASTPGNSLGSALITTGGVAGGWFARVHNAGPQGGASYRVAAICEGPTPGTAPPPPPPPDPNDPTPVDPLNPTIPTPTNAFKFGAFFRHKDRGIGALVLKVPGPGEATLRSKKFKFQVNTASEAGKVGLSVLAAKGGPAEKLDRTGKLKAKAAITYTPDGGAPNTQKIKLKLIKD